MESSVVIHDSSSPSSSSGFQQAPENKGEDCDCLIIKTKISDLNQQCQDLGHELSRLVFENVENDEKLVSSKRRIEEFNRLESRLSCEIEQLERKILKLMIEKRLKDDKLEQYGIPKEFEDMKQNKLEQKFLNLMPERENKSEKGESFREVENPGKKEMGDVNDKVHWSNDDDDDVHYEIKLVNASDNGESVEEETGEIGECELCKQIDLLELMLERGSSNLLDVKMMMQEVEALNGPEEMMNEMDVKMIELESGLWQLKCAVEELKGKKSMELMSLVAEEVEEELRHDGKEEVNARKLNWGSEVNARKLNWGSVIASIGAVVGAVAAAVVLMRRTGVKVAADRRHKQKTG